MKDGLELEESKGEIIDDLVFTIFALIILGYIYSKTNLESGWFKVLTIKKGLFSSLIDMLWNNLFYTGELIGYINAKTNVAKYLEGSSISFSLLI